MQTFMPYPNFIQSLSCLDNKRLGKQRVEAKQILTAIRNDKWYIKYPKKLFCWILRKKYRNPWFNHPAVQMWIGYENALKMYYNLSLILWEERGKINNMKVLHVGKLKFPSWYGNEDFHRRHQSNLLRKDPEFYEKYKWKVPNNLSYIWPSNEVK